MKFVVVIATIRQVLPGFDETMGRIQKTFVEPTEFHILDGSDGKAQALNRAFDEILAKSDADCYVTMDDDIIPGPNWQKIVGKAFRAMPRYGAFGLWMGDDPEMRRIMADHCLDTEASADSVVFRRVRPPHHLNGGFIAYRPSLAREVGKIPTEGIKYQLWEDAWRGRRVTKLGWEMAFLKGAEVEMINYPDTTEYLAMKQSDLSIGRARSERVLAESGLGDPISIRLRKFIAKMRGRS